MPKKVEESQDSGGAAKGIALISEKHLKTYHKQALMLGERIASAAGELRELTGEYVEDKNLNSIAYGWIKKLAKIQKMQDQGKAREKVAAILASFDHMRDILDLDDFAQLQGRMFSDGTGRPSAEVTGEDDEETRDLRPRHLRQPGASAQEEPNAAVNTATEHVRALAAGTGATLPSDEDPLNKLGRGPQHKPH